MRFFVARTGRRFLQCAGITTILVAASAVLPGVAIVNPISKAFAVACTETWNNPSGGDWNLATNWTPNMVPGGTDNACITLSGTYTITEDSNDFFNSFQLGGTTGTQTLVIGSGVIFHIDGASNVSTNGVLMLGDTSSASNTDLNTGSSPPSTLTNDGHIDAVLGSGGTRNLWVSVDNATDGVFDVGSGAAVNLAPNGETFTNQGTFTVESGGGFGPGGGNGTQFVNWSGSITDNGSFFLGGPTAFTEGGGTTSGNPIGLTGALTYTGTGASSFDMTGGSVTGNMAVGQNLAIDANSAYTAVTYNAPATVAGALTMINTGGASSSTAYLDIAGSNSSNQLTLAPPVLPTNPTGGSLTVDAPMADAQVSGYLTNSGTVTLDTILSPLGGTTITNDRTFTVAAGGSLGPAGSNGTAFLNNGVVSVASTGNISWNNGGSNAFTQSSTGTFADTIDATTSAFGQLNGGGAVVLAGTLDITTVGTPAVGSTWAIIDMTGGSTGTFATYGFGTVNYSVAYPATGVTLTVDQYTPSVTTTLSMSSPITTGTSVHDSATLNGATSNASGTISYGVYSDMNCTSEVQDLTPTPSTFTGGGVPQSNPYTFNSPGTFYFKATYSGDTNNAGPVSSSCSSEQMVVNAPSTPCTRTITGAFKGNLTVPNGGIYCLTVATVKGNVTVQTGGTLYVAWLAPPVSLSGPVTITGNLSVATGASLLTDNGTTIDGNVTSSGQLNLKNITVLGNLAESGDSAGFAALQGGSVAGSLTFSSNTAALVGELQTTVGKNASFTNNTGTVAVVGGMVGQNLSCTGNGSMVNGGTAVVVAGHASGQCVPPFSTS